VGDNDVDLPPQELGRDLGRAFAASCRPAIFDDDGATLNPTERVQPLHKSGDPFVRRRSRDRTQEPDHRHRRLLRARLERPRGRTTKHRDELAPSQVEHRTSFRLAPPVSLPQAQPECTAAKIAELQRLFDHLDC
jgi:hypothetical protein